MATKKYRVVVIDPPWELKKLTHKARPKQVGFDYSTMSVEQIKSLPIGNLVRPDGWVFLWSIQKYLYEAKGIVESWGLNLLLTGVWEKTYGRSAGMPLYGFRWNAEFILVAYKNKPPLWPKRPLIPAVFQAENIRHSVKPDHFYELVEPLGIPRLDMFARREREGWDVYGNEVENSISI